MADWRTEFQYLLDRKILSRDELGYLFGQIKSIIEAENTPLKEAIQKAGDILHNTSRPKDLMVEFQKRIKEIDANIEAVWDIIDKASKP